MLKKLCKRFRLLSVSNLGYRSRESLLLTTLIKIRYASIYSILPGACVSPYLIWENANAMLLIVLHDRFQAAVSSDEAAQEEDFNSSGSWKWKRCEFRGEIE
ncbi:hypothetical protein Dimus_029105 [Dionaea muscipula]